MLYAKIQIRAVFAGLIQTEVTKLYIAAVLANLVTRLAVIQTPKPPF